MRRGQRKLLPRATAELGTELLATTCQSVPDPGQAPPAFDLAWPALRHRRDLAWPRATRIQRVKNTS